MDLDIYNLGDYKRSLAAGVYSDVYRVVQGFDGGDGLVQHDKSAELVNVQVKEQISTKTKARKAELMTESKARNRSPEERMKLRKEATDLLIRTHVAQTLSSRHFYDAS